MTGLLRRLAVATVFAIAPTAVLVARLSWGGKIPDPLPTHWNAHGQVDGTMAANTFFWVCLAIAIGLAIAGVVAVMSRGAARRNTGSVGAAAFTAWLFAAVYTQVLNSARGAATANNVSLPWQTVIAIFVPGIAAAVLVLVALPRTVSATPSRPPESSLRVPGQQQVTWIGGARSLILRWVALVLALAAAGTTFVSWGLAVALLVGAIATAWVHMVTVRIDGSGVHTLWGPAGRPRSTIPLADIAAARSQHINPRAWGGWGYRTSRHGRAAIVRTGPGLVIERSTRPTYVVTVEHADNAAQLVNALLARKNNGPQKIQPTNMTIRLKHSRGKEQE